jgi:hypothetical protein
VGAGGDAEVGAADRGAVDAEDDLAVARMRLRPLLEHE